MKDKLRDIARLEHILESCRILLSRKDSDNLDAIKNDPIKFYGYVKLIEIIGEASYRLDKDFRNEHTNIPWKLMEGMRHVLVHEYYQISPEKLWITICNDIPNLTLEIKSLLSEIKGEGINDA